jgi:hypothetical protein
VGKIEEYRAALRDCDDVAAYLTANSGLPGPRCNIELAQALADEGSPTLIDALIATDDEYLVFCGVMGLGRMLATGGSARPGVVRRLRRHAADERWRVREAVAMALQRLGEADLAALMRIVNDWADDPHPLVQRAAVAGICEPRLLKACDAAGAAIDVCDRVTRSLSARPGDERRDRGVRALRQALGYCWSVAVVSSPRAGLPRFQALSRDPDPDVAWIARENSKKARLARLSAGEPQQLVKWA